MLKRTPSSKFSNSPSQAHPVRQFSEKDVAGQTRDGFAVLTDGKVVTAGGHVKGQFNLSLKPEFSSFYFHNDQLMRMSGRPSSGQPSPASLKESAVGPRNALQEDSALFCPVSDTADGPRFPKRLQDAPTEEPEAVTAAMRSANKDEKPPGEILKDLAEARGYFEGLIKKRKQTEYTDSLMTPLIGPILNSENERNVGLNAMLTKNAEQIEGILRSFPKGNSEVNLRFHHDIDEEHSVAIDAFRHKDGKFTLLAVDSAQRGLDARRDLDNLKAKLPELIAETKVINGKNQAHDEGCRTFAAHYILALHEYEPHFRNMHGDLRRKAEEIRHSAAAPETKKAALESLQMVSGKNARSLLPPKFYKHVQSGNYLTKWEQANPTLANEWMNKKNQTLRQRFQPDPEKALTYFDNSLSLDKKTIVLIQRAENHYKLKT